jgi:uncharacterized membrane protein YagU involved in acid resistance
VTRTAELATPTSKTNALQAIFWGGLACGILDISSALVSYGLIGVKPVRILQSVASGWLGPAAFQGGIPTAVLGTAFHFLIAFSAATVYYLASRKLAFMRLRPLLAGILYGEAVFLFMHFVVIPLSHARQSPMSMSLPFLIAGPLGHPFFVGLPIAFAVRRYASSTA